MHAKLSPFLIASIFLVGSVAGGFIGLFTRKRMQSVWRDTLSSWAEKNDYQLSEVTFMTSKKGPFAWTTVRTQGVYHVIVTDKTGSQREAWVRVSNWPSENKSSNVEIRWDEPK
jgi:transposase-like protein